MIVISYTLIFLYNYTGPQVKNIGDLERVNRLIEPPLTGPFCDLLWSDPLLEHILRYKLNDQNFSEVSQ